MKDVISQKMRTLLLFSFFTLSHLFGEQGFTAIVLGSGGGPLETNLSSYMITAAGSDEYVAIDAGSLLGGLAASKIDPLPTLREKIKAYLITHAHLDHVSGLIINSPVDTKKPILALPPTINNIRDHLFNWKIWPNFGSEGKRPLHQYQYIRLTPGEKTPIPATPLDVIAFPLSHPNGYTSTAFLLSRNDSYLLFFGDTSSDAFEKKKHIQSIWQYTAPLIKEKKLRHIFLECSYTNATPDEELDGHLKPTLWIQEFERLASLINPKDPKTALVGLHAYVTHIKEPPPALSTIQRELEELNTLGLILHFPTQGERLSLSN